MNNVKRGGFPVNYDNEIIVLGLSDEEQESCSSHYSLMGEKKSSLILTRPLHLPWHLIS